MMSKNKKKTYELPEGVTTAQLKAHWIDAIREYGTDFKRMRILDGADRGHLWKTLGAKFPKFQILPDTNHVSYVKNNLLASIYSVGKCADLQHRTEDDKGLITDLNIMLQYFWDLCDVSLYQMQAGERAALLNIGITQVGWDPNAKGFSKKTGMPMFKDIRPDRFMRDPYAEDLDTAEYCMTWEYLGPEVLKANPNYTERIQEYIKLKKSAEQSQTTIEMNDKTPRDSERRAGGKYKLITHWVRVGADVHEIHTIDNTFVLYVKEKILPARFPFAILHCNLPAKALVGTSEPAKIFANSLAYNMTQSMRLTNTYKRENPLKFVNKMSGLDLNTFVKHGNSAGKTFLVNGDASKSVHYQQYPAEPATTPTILQTLTGDIQGVSGVDGKYTGRDTGSVITTGGIQQMLDQATMIDAPKVRLYEKYTKQLTDLLLDVLLQFADTRSYLVQDPKTGTAKCIEVDNTEFDTDSVRHYTINISTMLPNNRARVAQMANIIMEKQMQYQSMGLDVKLITEEEWLFFQDFPNKEAMMERMGMDRSKNYTEMVAKTLTMFSELTLNGADPQDAANMVADQLMLDAQGGGDLSNVVQPIGPMQQQGPPRLTPEQM